MAPRNKYLDSDAIAYAKEAAAKYKNATGKIRTGAGARAQARKDAVETNQLLNAAGSQDTFERAIQGIPTAPERPKRTKR